MLTIPSQAPILKATASPSHPFPTSLWPQGGVLAERPQAISGKESGVGDEHDLAQDPEYVERRASLDQRFQALPAARTQAYWAEVERMGEDAPPLEVLVRCLRERLTAGAMNDVHRLYTIIHLRIQPTLKKWIASASTSTIPLAAKRLGLGEDIEEECYCELLRRLTNTKWTFAEENFWHVVKLIFGHARQAILEQAGFRQRGEVEQPTRVPRTATETLMPAVQGKDGEMIGQEPEDTESEKAFRSVEQRLDLETLFERAGLAPDQRKMLYDLYYLGFSQQEVAQELGVTDRTVRKRLSALIELVRQAHEEADAEYNEYEESNGGEEE